MVELKTEKGILSERQKLVFQQLESLGFPVTVLRSKEAVDDFIQKTCVPSDQDGVPVGPDAQGKKARK
jgi:hypothetical protein